MKKPMTYIAASLALACNASAQTPAPEKLLPENTLAAIVAPSLSRLGEEAAHDPFMRLLGDPAMGPFVDKITSGFSGAILAEINREIGFEIGSLLDLFQGQLSLAVTTGRAFQSPGAPPGFLILLDTKDQAPLLTNALSMLTEAAKSADEASLDRREIGSVPFHTFTSEEDDFAISVGQAGSVLIVGTETSDIEGVLARLEGSSTGALERNRRFRSDYGGQLSEASLYGWLHVKPLAEFAMEAIPTEGAGEVGAPDPKVVIEKLGLLAIQSLTFASSADASASEITFAINAPESERTGLLALTDGAKDLSTTPPAFIPADIASYTRSRVDLKDVVNRVEKLITEIVPPVGGMLQFMMAGVGKDQDTQFDLRRDFINQLGDDFITLTEAYDGSSLEEMASQPQLFLLGSPQPEKLQYALGILSSMIPADVFKKSERDYKGNSILSFEAELPEEVEAPGFGGLHFSVKDGYLAASPMVSTLESFLTADRVDNPLSRDSAFRAATEATGGSNTGMFSYENTRLTTAPFFDVLRSDESIAEIVEGALNEMGPMDAETFGQWLDLSLLPEASAVAKYFPITTATGRKTKDGFEFKLYSPTPRELR